MATGFCKLSTYCRHLTEKQCLTSSMTIREKGNNSINNGNSTSRSNSYSKRTRSSSRHTTSNTKENVPKKRVNHHLRRHRQIINIVIMNILQLKELTDELMNFSLNNFNNFIEIALNKDLCELFQAQAIREMSSLSSLTIDQLTHVLTFEIDELKGLKKSLGFTTSDGNFHLRLGHQKLLEHLLFLVQSKKHFVCQES
ncbi:unnamed protein product [Rotaria socialis]|uniref:Uncharacterized protein n=2 Tax=Rotaria socialis TaxID=392032 RepID=A0A819AHC9_9BILA|nr:unnamed protein product [Rotaria socialis]